MKPNHKNSLSLSLLRQLKPVIKQMLKNPELWDSLDVDYHPPRVERLFTNIGKYRVHLHVIHETNEDCLLHKHKWPSVIEILDGSYEMGVTYSDKELDSSSIEAEELPILIKTVMTKGSKYEMFNTDALHYVKPLNDLCFTIMITEDLYPEAKFRKESLDKELKKIEAERKDYILKIFNHYL